MAEGTCVVCRRRDPTSGTVCTPDMTAIGGLLDDLPRKIRLLPLMLVPGQQPSGERVSTSRVGSPAPARLDALSLVGPGAVAVPGALHPLVRRWSTSREVEVVARVGTYRRDRHTTVLTEWHQEFVVDPDTGRPFLVPDDDQTGILPPVEWLDQWVCRWRAAFGHHVPNRTRVVRRIDLTAADYEEAVDRFTAGIPSAIVRGVADDPVAAEVETRFGKHRTPRASTWDVAYLRTWLESAASATSGVNVAGFASELRSLSAELTRVLGEQPDQQWLGRCPAELTDRADGTHSVCGAGLWQDPHASVVECPRCHSSWGPRHIHLVHLAAEIRRVWPLDRRRRYHADEIDALRQVRCPECGQEVSVSWQEVTGVGDRRRWWRPTRTTCPDGGCVRGSLL